MGDRAARLLAVHASVDPALFQRDGAHVFATSLCRGPWDPRHCHGGPVGALLAHHIEATPVEAAPVEAAPVEAATFATATDPNPWAIVRLTVELTRPVPVLAPLQVRASVVRPGRKVSLVEASIVSGDGTEVARARALRLRSGDVPLPDGTVFPTDPVPRAPDLLVAETPTWAYTGEDAFHSHACELRFAEGSWADLGPCTAWIRLRVPVLEDVPLTGVQRALAAADFGNGISRGLAREELTFINPDLTVYLLRPPVGDWIALSSASHYGSRGAGMAESALYDRDGRVGRSVQSLLVDRRPA